MTKLNEEAWYVEKTKKCAYLFVHFVGAEKSEEEEQIYFSVSVDGKEWILLNKGKPFLKNNVGEHGARDPYIVRSPETGKYYVIATNLSIFHRSITEESKLKWIQCQNRRKDNPNPGTQSIVIWESDDLLHWSDARLGKVAPDDGGCYWAPECVWDKNKNAFMVFGASRTERYDYDALQIYRCYTKDFITFTKPELYLDGRRDTSTGSPMNVFDMTITESNGMYYRIYKTDRIKIDVAETLDGTWMAVNTNIHEIASFHEGPTICRLNGSKNWCLMLDSLSDPKGYHPFVTEDLASGQFFLSNQIVLPEDVSFRHGTLITITSEEYSNLMRAHSN